MSRLSMVTSCGAVREEIKAERPALEGITPKWLHYYVGDDPASALPIREKACINAGALSEKP